MKSGIILALMIVFALAQLQIWRLELQVLHLQTQAADCPLLPAVKDNTASIQKHTEAIININRSMGGLLEIINTHTDTIKMLAGVSPKGRK